VNHSIKILRDGSKRLIGRLQEYRFCENQSLPSHRTYLALPDELCPDLRSRDNRVDWTMERGLGETVSPVGGLRDSRSESKKRGGEIRGWRGVGRRGGWAEGRHCKQGGKGEWVGGKSGWDF